MILITGATGNLGRATIDSLLKKGVQPKNIAALVRDAEKAEDLKEKGIDIRLGDYNDKESLHTAFKDIEQVLLVSGNDMQNREEQHENVITAAKRSGVQHIYYTSFEREGNSKYSPIYFLAKSHIFTEDLIRESGMSYTIFRNGLYADVLPMFFGEQVMENGIFFPAGQTKASYTARNDMAEAIANVLNTGGHENKEYTLQNTEEVSLSEIADILSVIAGKQILYYNPTSTEYMKMAENSGVPKMYVGFMASFGNSIKNGEHAVSKSDLESLLGRKPISIRQFLSETYSSI